jgi:vacuolar-type H+-ATPase subunit E/Vma4
MSATTVQATRAGPTAPAGLDPLREALLRAARAEATRLVADADAEADATLARARAEVDARLEQARARGRAEGAERLEASAAVDRRASRERLLRAQGRVHAELVGRARSLVAELLADPARRRGLEARLRSQLGPGAVVEATEDGGLLGWDASGRTVDASVATLVADALADLDLTDLWTLP